jgi:hypothetical protein
MRIFRYALLAGFCIAWAAPPSFAQGGYGSTFAFDIAPPLGVFGESFKTGYGGHAEFFMESESYLRLYVNLGYARWKLDSEGVNKRYAAEGGTGTLEVDGHVSAFPLLVGAKLLSPEGGMRFYGLLEVGVYLYSGTIEGQKIVNGTPNANIFEETSNTVAGANLGVGLLFPVSKDLSLDLGGRYHFVKRDTYYTYSSSGNATPVSTDKYFSVALGLTFAFTAPAGK